MIIKKLIPVILVILVTVIVIILFSPGDQKKIEIGLRKGERAIREESTSKIMSLVSREYTDKYGLTYDGLKKVFFRMFLQIDSIEVHYSITSIAITKKKAAVVLDVFVSGIMTGGRRNIIGKKDNPEQLKLTFAKKRFSWSVIESEWQNHLFLEELFGIPYKPVSL